MACVTCYNACDCVIYREILLLGEVAVVFGNYIRNYVYACRVLDIRHFRYDSKRKDIYAANRYAYNWRCHLSRRACYRFLDTLFAR